MNNKHHKSVVDAARENLQTNKQTIQQTFRKQKMKQLTKWMNGRMNIWDIRWQKEEEIKKKRKKSKSDMIEWEIDETQNMRMKEEWVDTWTKKCKDFFIYRNENRNYISLDRGCSGFYPTTWNFDSNNPLFRVKYLKGHQTHSTASFVAFT